MRSEEEIKWQLKDIIDICMREFPEVEVPVEKFPRICYLKGFIDGLKYVLQGDNQWAK